MTLADVPIVIALAGLVAYVVLGGADFGAGLWQLGAGRGERGTRVRDHTYHAMGPVWEANHVWLIFVLVICWTAYPEAFASIASTLTVPLLVAAVGIILRGTSYAVRGAGLLEHEEPFVRAVFVVASLLTPFALGTVVGAIASGRVPVGNAAGDLWSSWLAPTPILIGVLAVATAGYLAAVYLAADAARAGAADLVAAFRARALGAGVVAGAAAIGGLLVVRADVRGLFDDLTSGGGLAAVAASAALGLATLSLVTARRFEAARYSAAGAVAAIVVGWALAQQPVFLPGLTVREAAAGHETLVAVVVGTGIGAAVLAPSLALLFSLVLRGRFEEPPRAAAPMEAAAAAGEARRARTAPPVVLYVVGAALMIAGEGAVLAAGVALLLAAVAWTFAAFTSAGLSR